MPKPCESPDALREMKQLIAAAIVARVAGWTQAYAATFLDTWQPRISDLRNQRVDSFSLDQLIRYAMRLDVVVRLEIEWLDNRRSLFDTLPATRIEVRCQRG
jgi:predicted XRE-type DNA-binding protein